MKWLNNILFFIAFSYPILGQNIDLEKQISINLNGQNLEQATKLLAKTANLLFSYTDVTIQNSKILTCNFSNQSLKTIFNTVFQSNQVDWLIYNNQIILRPMHKSNKIYRIEGIVQDKDDKNPISYTSIEIKGKAKGTIADLNGNYEIQINESNFDDTLVFSSIGYHKQLIPIKTILQSTPSLIFLTQKITDLPTSTIYARNFKNTTLGNTKNRSIGSIYMDTHGQQTAIYIENSTQLEGELKSINYYLCKEGNTEAPFRIRIYEMDTLTGKPGNDLLEEILIIKPTIKKGWYSVDISKYHIKLSENGLFVAFQGIFPNDYDFYIQGSDFISTNEDLIDENNTEEINSDNLPSVISYGQRIGYTRSKNNNTWHYSLSHTWFQLKKQNVGVMISADVRYIKKSKKQFKKT